MKTITNIPNPMYRHQHLSNEALSLGVKGDYASAAQLLLEAWQAGSLLVAKLFNESSSLPAGFNTNLKQKVREVDDYTQGLMYLFGCGIKRNNGRALDLFRLAAKQGHVTAQYILACMYKEGRGVGGKSEANDREAVRLLQLAAGQGNSGAQINLATMYKEGRGVGGKSEANDREAVRLLQLAAGQGNSGAQINLATMYKDGRGVGGQSEDNDREAVRLLQLVAEPDNIYAQINIAIMCKEGRGVGGKSEANDREAVRLLQLVAGQGNSDAQYILATMYKESRGIDGQHDDNDREAVRLLQLAAEQGNSHAQINLAIMYKEGRGVGGKSEANVREAVRLLQLAAGQGNSGAQINLATMYKDGYGVGGKSEANDREAVRLLQLAAGQSNSGAQINLAIMYKEGRGVGGKSEANDREAVRLLQLAAGQSNSNAQINLAIMYKKGRGVGGKSEANDREAVRLLQLAVQQGHRGAQRNLAYMYKAGHGVGGKSEANDREAVRLYRLAAEQGDADAADRLAGFYLEKQKIDLALSWYSFSGVIYACQSKKLDVSRTINAIKSLSVSEEKMNYAIKKVLTATGEESELALLSLIDKFSNASDFQYFAVHDIKQFSDSKNYHQQLAVCCEKWRRQLNAQSEASEVKALIKILIASSVEQLKSMYEVSEAISSENCPLSIGILTALPSLHMYLTNLESTEIEAFKSMVFEFLTATLVSVNYNEKFKFLKLTSMLIQNNHIVTQDASLNRLLVKALISVFSQGSLAPDVELQCLDLKRLDVLVSLLLTMTSPSDNALEGDGDELNATNIELGQLGLKLMEAYGISLPTTPSPERLFARGDENSRHTELANTYLKSSTKHQFFPLAQNKGDDIDCYNKAITP